MGPRLTAGGYRGHAGSMWKRIVAAAVCVVSLVPAGALGGQVDYEDMPFATLLGYVRDGHATLALVTLETPAAVRRAYPVPGGAGKTCEAYDFVDYRAEVVRVVRAGKGLPALATGTRIAVVPANTPDLVDLTRRACLEGVSKSPIWPRYKKGVEPADGARVLVVLTWHEGYGWIERVDGAWLAASELRHIERWLGVPEGEKKELD